MKKYYVYYYMDFGNTYNLYWAETDAQVKMAEEAGFERITRKEAEKLCAAENRRSKEDYNFSGYASSVIMPIDHPDGDWRNDKNVRKEGCMILYNK